MSPVRARIAFVGVSPTARGGIAQFGANLATAVADDNDAVVVAYRRLYPRVSPAGRQPPDPGARHRITTLYAGLVPWEPWTWRAAERELDRFAADLVVFQWWNPLFGPCVRHLARCARRSGSRTLVVCHNARPHERFVGWRRLTLQALDEADALVALSDTVAAELARLVPGRQVDVLAHPPNLPRVGSCGPAAWRARLAPLDERPIVLFFGNVREYKGLEDLIDAFALMRRPAQLVIAGKFFQPLGRFRRQVAGLGVDADVRFWPDYVPSDEAAALFELADVVVLPYRRASQSGVIAQAALAGKPVVATSVGGLPAAVAGGGVVVPPQQPDALARGLDDVLTSAPGPPPFVTWEHWGELLRGHARTVPAPARPLAAGIPVAHMAEAG